MAIPIPLPQPEPPSLDTVMPIEEPARDRVSHEIETIRTAVSAILSRDTKKFDEESAAILTILLSTTERLEAVNIRYIAAQLGTPEEEIENLRRKVDSIASAIARNTKTGININRQRVSKKSYLYLDTERNKPIAKENTDENIQLEQPIQPYTDKERLAKRISLAIQKTADRGILQKSYLSSLMEACLSERSVTIRYCIGRLEETNPDNELAQKSKKEFLYTFRQIVEKRPEEYGFRIINDPSTGRWQAELVETQRDFDAETSRKEATVENRNALFERVTSSVKHLATVRDSSPEKVGCFLLILLENTLEGKCMTVQEIIDAGKERGETFTIDGIHMLFRRIREINEEDPNVLGYKIAKMGDTRYQLELTATYKETDIGYHRAPVYPVKIEGLVFDKILYDSTASLYLKSSGKGDDPKGKFLGIMAAHAERSEGLSFRHISHLLGTDIKQTSRIINSARQILKRNNWGIFIEFDEDKKIFYMQTVKTETKHPEIEALRIFAQEKALSGQAPIDIEKVMSEEQTLTIPEALLEEAFKTLKSRGFRIERASLLTNLTKIYEDRIKAHRRILANQHHFDIADQEVKKLIFDFLADKALKGQRFTVEEIFNLAEEKGVKVRKRYIQGIIRRIRDINDDEPTILGYTLRQIGKNLYQHYIVEGAEVYTPTELKYEEDFAVVPVKVTEPFEFDREIFERTMSRWTRTKGKRGMTPLSLMNILFIELADHSGNKEAVSATLIEHLNKGKFKAGIVRAEIRDMEALIKKHDGKRSPVQLVRYKKHTYYLKTQDNRKGKMPKTTMKQKAASAIKRMIRIVNKRPPKPSDTPNE